MPSLPLETDIGVIELWSGSIATIPPGWSLCDGTNGTPDMRDQFSIVAGPLAPVGDVQDDLTHDHTFTGDGHQHTITTPGTVLASGAGTSNTTTTSPAHGTTATTRQPPPYYSLAYVMYTGP